MGKSLKKLEGHVYFHLKMGETNSDEKKTWMRQILLIVIFVYFVLNVIRVDETLCQINMF